MARVTVFFFLQIFALVFLWSGALFAESQPMLKITPAPVLPNSRQARALELANTRSAIEQLGSAMLNAHKRGALAEYQSILAAVERLKNQHNVGALEDLSVQVLEVARAAAAGGNTKDARALLDVAKRLSPLSPVVLFKSLDVAFMIEGPGEMLKQLGQAVDLFWGYPLFWLQVLIGLLYPSLWAVTVACYLAFIFLFIARMPVLFRRFLGFCPGKLAGLVTPVCIGALLIIPCFSGPIAVLTVWALLAAFLLEEQKQLGVAAAVIVLLWASTIPFRERVFTALSEPAIERFLSSYLGDSELVNKDLISALLRHYQDDGVLWYVYGDLQLQDGELKEAQEAFTRAELLLGPQGYTKAAFGRLAFARQDFKRADALYAEAETAGLNTAAFYLQYAKIKSELLDLKKSSHYFKLAKSLDRSLAAALLEEEVPTGTVYALGALALPSSYLVGTLLHPSELANQRTAERFRCLFLFDSVPFVWAWAGLLMIAVLVLKRSVKIERYKACYQNYKVPEIITILAKVIPGAALVLKGSLVAGIVFLSAAMFLLFSIVQWPMDNLVWVPLLGELGLPYMLFCLGTYLSLAMIVAYLTQEQTNG